MSGALTGILGGSVISTASSTLAGAGLFGVRATQSMIQALPDIAPNWMWTCDIVNVPSLGGITNLYARSVSFTHDSFDIEQRYRNGVYQTFPRHQLVHPVSVMFYEPTIFSITQCIYNWQNLIRNKTTGFYGLPCQYMGSLMLTLFDPVGIPQLVMELDGVWPIGITGETLAYDHSDAIQTMVEFSTNGCNVTYTGSGLISLFANAVIGAASSIFSSNTETNFNSSSDNVIGGGDGLGDAAT